jgi:hypothetical protein
MRILITLLICLAPLAHADESHFLTNIHIADGDTLEGNFALYKGNLFLEGHIQGKVSVMFGDCALSESGTISGDLSVLQGSLDLPKREQVSGRIFQKDITGHQQTNEDPFASHNSFDEMHALEGDSLSSEDGSDDEESASLRADSDDGFMSFNRVAGLQLGMRFQQEMKSIHQKEILDFNGLVYYAFGAHRPEWRIKMRRRLIPKFDVYMALGHHRLTDTVDGWMIDSDVNSLAGVFMHKDYRDYFDNKGVEIECGAYALKDRFHLSVGAFREHYAPMSNGTRWSWKNGRTYLPNLYNDHATDYINRPGRLFNDSIYPSASNEGLRLAFQGRFGDTNENCNGGQFTLKYEVGKEEDSGFDYERILAKASFHLKFREDAPDVYSMRFLAGINRGDAPEHYAYRLGGPGSLPGYRTKSLDGFEDRHDSRLEPLDAAQPHLLLVNFEDRIDADFIPFWPFDTLLLLADVGSVFSKPFNELEAEDLHADMGFGFAEVSDDVELRLAMYRSTESGRADWRLALSFAARF